MLASLLPKIASRPLVRPAPVGIAVRITFPSSVPGFTIWEYSIALTLASGVTEVPVITGSLKVNISVFALASAPPSSDVMPLPASA